MPRNPEFSPKPILHIELFATPRRRRNEVRRRLSAAYDLARRPTHAFGGAGPWVYRITSPARSTRVPADARLRRVLGITSGEDLWVELAFYSGSRERTATMNILWKSPLFRKIVARAERLNSHRVGTWTADLGRLLAV